MANEIPGAGQFDPSQQRPLPMPVDENRANPNDFGAQAGDGADTTAARLSQVQQVTQARTNEAVEEGAFGKAQQAYNDIIANPQTGYSSLKGADAVTQGSAYRQKFQQQLSAITGSLSEAQRQRVGLRIDRFVAQPGMLAMENHERQQHDVLAEASFRGSEAATTDAISQLAADPTSRGQDISDQIQQLVHNAQGQAIYKFGGDATSDAVKAYALPMLNKAASSAMSEALSTGDAQHAAKVLQLVGPYLGTHAKLYTGAVNKLLTQQDVTTEAEKVMLQATTPTAMPDGSSVARPDPAKIETLLSSLPAGPNNAAIVERVRKNQNDLDGVWKKVVAQQLDAAKRAGDPDATGDFDMGKVPAIQRQWLQQNDESSLIALRALQNKTDRQDSRQAYYDARDASERTTGTMQAQIVDKDNRDLLLKTTPEEYQANLLKGLDLNGAPLPEPLTPKDRTTLVAGFRQAQKDAGANQLDEKPAALVAARIQLAAKFNPQTMFEMTKNFGKVLNEKANAWVAANKGKATQEGLEKYIDGELATGKVKGSSNHWFTTDDTKRRIEYETDPKYAGKVFEPDVPIVDVQTAAIPPQPTVNSPVAQPPTAPPPGMIRVVHPDGRTGAIPADKLDKALQQGFKRAD